MVMRQGINSMLYWYSRAHGASLTRRWQKEGIVVNELRTLLRNDVPKAMSRKL